MFAKGLINSENVLLKEILFVGGEKSACISLQNARAARRSQSLRAAQRAWNWHLYVTRSVRGSRAALGCAAD